LEELCGFLCDIDYVFSLRSTHHAFRRGTLRQSQKAVRKKWQWEERTHASKAHDEVRHAKSRDQKLRSFVTLVVTLQTLYKLRNAQPAFALMTWI